MKWDSSWIEFNILVDVNWLCCVQSIINMVKEQIKEMAAGVKKHIRM